VYDIPIHVNIYLLLARYLPVIEINKQSNKERIMKKSNKETVCDRLINGYDYDNQAWVIDGKYVRCGHPENMDCGCYGKEHEGEQTS